MSSWLETFVCLLVVLCQSSARGNEYADPGMTRIEQSLSASEAWSNTGFLPNLESSIHRERDLSPVVQRDSLFDLISHEQVSSVPACRGRKHCCHCCGNSEERHCHFKLTEFNIYPTFSFLSDQIGNYTEFEFASQTDLGWLEMENRTVLNVADLPSTISLGPTNPVTHRLILAFAGTALVMCCPDSFSRAVASSGTIISGSVPS